MSLPENRRLRHALGLPGMGTGRIVLLYHALDPCTRAGGMPSWGPVVDGDCWVPWGVRPPHQTRTFVYDPGSSAAAAGCHGVHSLRCETNGYLLSRKRLTAHTLDVCLVSCGSFFWPRRNEAPEFPLGLRFNRRVTSTAWAHGVTMTVPHDDAPHKHPHALHARGGTTRPPAVVDPAARAIPDNDAEPGLAPEPCPRCGAIDVPTLSAGTGPHACKASCAHCGRFLRWISLLAPSERMAHRLKARLAAMQKHPASAAQLALLLALGDTQAVPKTMAEASQRIEQLKAKNSNASGWRP